MSNDVTPENLDTVYLSERVDSKLGRVALNLLDVDFEGYSFRTDDELSDDGIKILAEDIAVHGMATPILVVGLPNGRFRLLNGHRRYGAVSLNIKLGVDGFSDDMLLPAHIMEGEPSELALVSRAVAANVQQRTLSAEGRQKAVIRLKQLGMPSKEIARCVAVSEPTVERDLALAGSGCMLDHVRDRNITGTHAAELVKAAEAAGRMDDLCDGFANWLEDVQAKIRAEEERRRENDEKPLSPAETWPRRYLTSAQIRAWKVALEKGLPLQAPSFKFRALIKGKKGEERVVIDAVKAKVADLSAKDMAKLLIRCVDLAEALKPLVEEKAEAEKKLAAVSDSASGRPSKGRETLKALGLDHLIDTSADADEGEDANGDEDPLNAEIDPTKGEASDAEGDAEGDDAEADADPDVEAESPADRGESGSPTVTASVKAERVVSPAPTRTCPATTVARRPR